MMMEDDLNDPSVEQDSFTDVDIHKAIRDNIHKGNNDVNNMYFNNNINTTTTNNSNNNNSNNNNNFFTSSVFEEEGSELHTIPFGGSGSVGGSGVVGGGGSGGSGSGSGSGGGLSLSPIMMDIPDEGENLLHSEQAAKSTKKKMILIIISGTLLVMLIAAISIYIIVLIEAEPPAHPTSRTTVVLISIDGYRAGYHTQYTNYSTTLNRLANEGVYSALMPVFPTKTFPNHYTIVTGLYPETHGIVANTFYDPVFNLTFEIDDQDDVTNAEWWGGEPIWVPCERHKIKTGMFFWPGSEAPIMNVRPTYYEHYERTVTMEERVAGVVNWLKLPQPSRPNFIGMYLDIVDSMGHYYGPDSAEVAASIQTVDNAIGNLMTVVDTLKSYGNDDSIHVIIVSDHGMTAISETRVILVDPCIDLTQIRVVEWSPILYVIPLNTSSTLDIYESLASCHPNMTVYLKEDIPERFHYINNRRITPIVGIADLGWSITYTTYFNENRSYFNGGNHGYDNKYADMQALFIAHGAKFKQQQMEVPVSNLDIFNLISHILGIEYIANNGTNFLIDNILL